MAMITNNLAQARCLVAACAMFLSAHVLACNSEYREVISVSGITQNLIDPGTEPEVCGQFQLSEKQIVYFLKRAREVTPGTYAHDLDYAPCRVSGKLVLKSQTTATWEIELSGRARIVFDDGRVMLLSCPKCISNR